MKGAVRSGDSGEQWTVRKLVVVAALVLVILANVAYIVHVQNYIARLDAREAEAFAEEPIDTTTCFVLHKEHTDEAYYREDACFTRPEILQIIKQLVFTAAAAFETHNVTYFLDSGTLLGAFRKQRVIAHDDDADFGIDAAGLAYIQRNPIEFPREYAFTVWNSTLYPTSTRDDKLPARLIHRHSGIYIDVFAFLQWEDDKVGPVPSPCFSNCAKCPTVSTGGKALKVDRDWIYPVVDCEFEGAVLKCPHRTKTYLEYTFGLRFMEPVKYAYYNQ